MTNTGLQPRGQTRRDEEQQRLLDHVLTRPHRVVLVAGEGHGQDAVGDAEARHEDRAAADGRLIDHDRNPSLRLRAEREPNEQRRPHRPLQPAVPQEPIQAFGSHFLGLVERERPRERAERQSAVATPRAAPELEHRDGEQPESQREPTPQIRRGGGEQRHHPFDCRGVVRIKGPARPAPAPLGGRLGACAPYGCYGGRLPAARPHGLVDLRRLATQQLEIDARDLFQQIQRLAVIAHPGVRHGAQRFREVDLPGAALRVAHGQVIRRAVFLAAHALTVALAALGESLHHAGAQHRPQSGQLVEQLLATRREAPRGHLFHAVTFAQTLREYTFFLPPTAAVPRECR